MVITCEQVSVRPAASVTVQVIDDGSGMSERDLERAFEIGSRFDPERGGTGLGLAIARDLAEAMGLTLKLENTRNGFMATVRYQVT